MSDRDLEDKLRNAAAATLPGTDITALIDAVWQVDKSDDISSLAALAVPRE